jgi:hypothetical protein
MGDVTTAHCNVMTTLNWAVSHGNTDMVDVLLNSLSTTPQFLIISAKIARYFWMTILFVDLSTQDNIAVKESHL